MNLGDVCNIRSGLTVRKKPDDHGAHRGTLAVQQGDISASGEFNIRTASRINAPTWSSHLIRPDELVFRSRGPFWSAWAPGEFDEPLVAIAPLFILTPKHDIDPAYLAWHLGRPDAQRYFATEARGTNVQMISRGVLERLPITVPPLEVQQAVTVAASLLTQERDLTLRLAELQHSLLSAKLDHTTHISAADSRSTR